MHPVLSLYEDILSNGATLALPAHPRMIFVVHGIVTIAGSTLVRRRDLARRRRGHDDGRRRREPAAGATS